MKKTISLLVAVVMLLAMLPVVGAAAAEAGNSFQRKESVFARFARIYAQLLIYPGVDKRRTFEVTRSTVADGDLEFAGFDPLELGVKADNALDISFRAAEIFGGGTDGIIGNITVCGLDRLKSFDKISRFLSDFAEK